MNKKEKIINTIKNFSNDEHKEILKIILEQDNIKYSENSNGTFIDMDTINDTIIDKIENYIDYVLRKENDINQIEIKMNEIKKTF
jgi:hypothetical protein